MKKIFLTLAFCIFITYAFTQDTTFQKTNTQNTISIKVPDFADPVAKSFYQSYADHLMKCIKAIREKNETKVIALFKDPGEQLVAREKIISKEVVKNAVEKKKYMEFAAQVYPYIKEVEQSEYYKKMIGK